MYTGHMRAAAAGRTLYRKFNARCCADAELLELGGGKQAPGSTK